jgi:hypothetical protein
MRVKFAKLEGLVNQVREWVSKGSTFGGELKSSSDSPLFTTYRCTVNFGDKKASFNIGCHLDIAIRSKGFADATLSITLSDCMHAYTSIQINMEAKNWEVWASSLFFDLDYLGRQQLAIMARKRQEEQEIGLPTWEEFTTSK